MKEIHELHQAGSETKSALVGQLRLMQEELSRLREHNSSLRTMLADSEAAKRSIELELHESLREITDCRRAADDTKLALQESYTEIRHLTTKISNAEEQNRKLLRDRSSEFETIGYRIANTLEREFDSLRLELNISKPTASTGLSTSAVAPVVSTLPPATLSVGCLVSPSLGSSLIRGEKKFTENSIVQSSNESSGSSNYSSKPLLGNQEKPLLGNQETGEESDKYYARDTSVKKKAGSHRDSILVAKERERWSPKAVSAARLDEGANMLASSPASVSSSSSPSSSFVSRSRSRTSSSSSSSSSRSTHSSPGQREPTHVPTQSLMSKSRSQSRLPTAYDLYEAASANTNALAGNVNKLNVEQSSKDLDNPNLIVMKAAEEFTVETSETSASTAHSKAHVSGSPLPRDKITGTIYQHIYFALSKYRRLRST